MPNLRFSRRVMTGLAVALPAMALTAPASAQDGLPPLPAPVDVGPVDVRSVPPVPPRQSTTRPLTWNEEVTVGPDGVETIIRTRYIRRPTTYPGTVQPHAGHQGTYPVAPVVFSQEQWLAECERRTSGRSEKEKGGIIGGLLGAIGGGIAGNVIAGAGDRLAGTLIGAGTGGLAGLLLGSLIGGGKKNGRYDCEAALDGYMQQYGQPGAHRVIQPYPAGYGQGYGYGYGYGCGCAPQQQIVYVPVEKQVRQRVIVRERVREEIVPGPYVPPTPRPRPPRRPSNPKLIKQ